MQKRVVKIGSIPIKSITQEDVIKVAVIEGATSSFEFWNEPIIVIYDNDKFSDTVVIEYTQKRKSDGIERANITFFFNHVDFDYHFTVENDYHTRSGRLRIESLQYLIDKGYDIPIF